MIISSTGFINICKIQQIEIKFFPYLLSLVGMIVKHTYKRVKKKKKVHDNNNDDDTAHWFVKRTVTAGMVHPCPCQDQVYSTGKKGPRLLMDGVPNKIKAISQHNVMENEHDDKFNSVSQSYLFQQCLLLV